MKPKTFFKLALLVPYILWGICLLIVYLTNTTSNGEDSLSAIWDILLVPIMFYTLGALFWFVPYTLLAIGLLVWSLRRSTEDLRRASILSPLFLLVLMILEAVIFSVGTEGIGEIIKSTLKTSFLFGGFSLVFGYMCVGIAMGFYKLLQSKNLIKEETIIDIIPADT